MRLLRSLFVVSALLVIQCAIQCLFQTSKQLNLQQPTAARYAKPLALICLGVLMILVEFRTAPIEKNFGFTLNPYLKSAFVFLLSGIIYDANLAQINPRIGLTVASTAATGLLMLLIAPCHNKQKKN